MPRLEGTDNIILTDDVIAKEAMRLLKNNLVATRLCHRDHEQRFGSIGDTISVKKPSRIKSASGRTLVKQPMVDQVVAVKVDNQEHVGLEFNSIDRSLTLGDFSSRHLASGISQIAHAIDSSIIRTAKNAFFFSSGTPGGAVTSDNFVDAAAYMSMVGVPADNMCANLLNPLDAASYRKDLTSLNNPAMVKAAIERSYLGYMGGSESYETAQMIPHTVGALGGTPLVVGASQTGATLNVDGGSNSVTDWMLEGDVFTIAGVYEINPRTYVSTGRLQRFVCTADVDTSGTGTVTIPISPAINDGTVTGVDKTGASISLAAYQNVTAAPADNAAITVIGSAGTTYRQNLTFHRDAVSLAMIDIHLPESAPVAKRVRDEDTGLSLLLTAQYDINDMTETYRVDALWACDAIYPELGHRVWGG